MQVYIVDARRETALYLVCLFPYFCVIAAGLDSADEPIRRGTDISYVERRWVLARRILRPSNCSFSLLE